MFGVSSKSLSWNILRITTLFSIFCADKSRSYTVKFFGTKILEMSDIPEKFAVLVAVEQNLLFRGPV